MHSDQQRDKEQEKSTREEATKFEKFKRRNPRNQIERETKHLVTTVSFQVSLMFSFFYDKLIHLIPKWLPS